MSEKKKLLIESGEKLSPEQYKAISAAVIQIHEEQKIQRIKKTVDDRINNVRLLLRHYRKLKTYARNAVCEVKRANIILAESLCDVNNLSNELKVESIIRSRERTLVMIAHINKMTRIYKYMCEETKDQNDIRRWNVLFDMYLNPTLKLTADEISEKYHIDRSTVFSDITRACEDLGPLVFGVNGL